MKLENITRDSLRLILGEWGRWARDRTGPTNHNLACSYTSNYHHTAYITDELAGRIDKLVCESKYKREFVMFYIWNKNPLYIGARLHITSEEVMYNIEVLEFNIWRSLKDEFIL